MHLLLKISSFVMLLMLKIAEINCHTYHLGGSCASIEPMSNFTMDKFLGKWYVIQKTSTTSRCLVYNFNFTEYRKKFKVEQISENVIIGLVKNNRYHYVGNLEFNDELNQANMKVKFPLSILGEATFIVFMTDYESYAGVYSCQELGPTHRHSASILSRKRVLDRRILDKVRGKLASYNINPYDLNDIQHTDCSESDAYNINITDTTFSKNNIKKTVVNAGKSVIKGVDSVVNKVKNFFSKNKTDESNSYKDREEMTEIPYVHIDNEPSAELL